MVLNKLYKFSKVVAWLQIVKQYPGSFLPINVNTTVQIKYC